MAAKTILLVDDEILIHMVAADVLEEAGYRVIPAHDGVQALKALEPGIDLVVTDVMMPRMDGPEWVRRAREQGYPDTPVIFSSAVARPSIVEEFSNAEFLPKPYRLSELLLVVDKVLGPAEDDDS